MRFDLIIWLRHTGLLLAVLYTLLVGAQALAAQYDPTPAPVNISSAEVNAKLQNVKNSLFFLDSYCFFKKVKVEVDSFLVPNAQYAKMTFNWKSMVSKSGVNLLRKPTAKELKQEATFQQDPQIYCAIDNAKPAFATGSVQLQIPITFAHVTFAANEVNTQRQDGPLHATLQSCEKGTVALKVQGNFKDHNVNFVLSDAEGRRLTQVESELAMAGNSFEARYTVDGIIAKVDLYIPTAYVSKTLDVLAIAEPASFMVKTLDVKVPRFVPPGVAMKDAEYDLDTLKAQTAVIAGREYAAMDYNTPEIRIKLPHTFNSAFATIDFGKPELTDANGKTVVYTPEEGGFDFQSCSSEFRFTEIKGNMAFASGTIHLRYPAKLKIVTLTPAKPSNGTLQARFNGALVRLNGEDSTTSPFLPDDLASVRAYDAYGRQLRKLTSSGNEFINSVSWNRYAFWGKPAEIRVVTVEKWLTLDLPYHLPPADKLPVDQVGQKPANE